MTNPAAFPPNPLHPTNTTPNNQSKPIVPTLSLSVPTLSLSLL